jgi:translation initiation factor IF-3
VASLYVNLGFSEKSPISTNFRHNEQIRISPVRLINDKEEQVGIVSTSEALRLAREANLDLVEVAPNARPPVCRIMDYGKWRYQQQKKEDKSRASARSGRLKQLTIDTIRIGDHDLLIKVNRARDFLKEGNKVQFTLRFKGREMAHLDLGRVLFTKIKSELFLVSKIERDAKMEGKRMTMVLQPDHKNPNAVRPIEPTGPMRTGSGLNIPPRPAAAGAPIGASPPKAQGASTLGVTAPAAAAAPSAAAPAAAIAPKAVAPAASVAPVRPAPAPRPVVAAPAPLPAGARNG